MIPVVSFCGCKSLCVTLQFDSYCGGLLADNQRKPGLKQGSLTKKSLNRVSLMIGGELDLVQRRLSFADGRISSSEISFFRAKRESSELNENVRELFPYFLLLIRS